MKQTHDYKVVKACWLGKVDAVIALNARQSANLTAGGFVVPVAAASKKDAKLNTVRGGIK